MSWTLEVKSAQVETYVPAVDSEGTDSPLLPFWDGDQPARGWRQLVLGGVRVDSLTLEQVVRHVVDSALAGRGGTIVTPNLDHLALVRQGAFDRRLFDEADLAVPDGAPLVWASRLKNDPLPERVAGSDLLPALCRAAAAAELPVAFLGGRPGAASKLAAEMRGRHPGLHVATVICPTMGFEQRQREFEEITQTLVDADPAIVFTGLGAPKQETVNDRLRRRLPGSWLLGCGAAIDMHAGLVTRAPGWMQRSGTEWVWRLAKEPRRLAHRYLVRDLPFFVRLIAESAVDRSGHDGLEHRAVR